MISRLISALSPHWAYKRAVARRALAQLDQRSYEGGKLHRLFKSWRANRESADSAVLGELQRTRWRAWDLYRNNPYVRKIVRTIIAQTIGTGILPEPQAVRPDGTPYDEFRLLSKQLWSRWCKRASFRGSPGAGGRTWYELQQIQLKSTILNGESLLRFRTISDLSAIPLAIELISAERLSEELFSTSQLPNGHEIYRGIEFDAQDRRVAYWLYQKHPSTQRLTMQNLKSVPIPAEEILHLYIQDDEEAERGTCWLAPVILESRDIQNYKENELVASAVSACVALGYHLPQGSTAFGTKLPEAWDTTDTNSNTLTAMEPGMLIPLGEGGHLEGFNPQRPNSQIEGFAQFLLRGVAGAIPGIKSSTLTGDYRESSFSSERSAENDAWREIEILQDWLISNNCQPVYERWLDAAVEAGAFEGIVSAKEYNAQRESLTPATWSGPTSKSINPKEDEEASALAIKNGTSSPYKESAMRGYDARENLEELAAWVKQARSLGLPEEYILGALGVKAPPEPPKLKIGEGNAAFDAA